MKPITCFYLLAITFICACKSSGRDPNVILKGSIDVKTAKELVHNFESHIYHKEHPVIGFTDTRCVWFSKEQLQGLLTKVEAEDGDGVRFYFAAYPDDSTHRPYGDHSTLVMVSTLPFGGKHVDYFSEIANGKGTILTTTPENQGEMCPPPTPCATDGARLFN
jgi:hypothetical protein